jgi:protein-lysine N-methyltransferase EEF2KMT
MSSLTTLLTSPQQSAIEAAQQKSYVTYSLPSTSSELLFNTVTSFESRGLLASSGTTGFRTWEAALHLATYLSSEEGRSVVKNKNVLELGAGTGVVSCLCAKHLRARHVLATDGDVSVVEDIKTNVFLNGLADTGRMEASVFKWGHALLDGTLSFHDETVQFNVVIGADIVCFRTLRSLSDLTNSNILDFRCSINTLARVYTSRPVCKV